MIAILTWWMPGKRPGDHRETSSPAVETVEAAQRWCEQAPAVNPMMRVENAVVFDGAREVKHGYYHRRTRTWEWRED